VATIHLAQILYIWPLFAFFSAPLFLPYIIAPLGIFSRVYFHLTKKSATHTASGRREKPKTEPLKGASRKSKETNNPKATLTATAANADESSQTSPLLATPLIIVIKPVIKAWRSLNGTVKFLFIFSIFALFIVHYNTIIHPFTLADNRHYMFYIFRYTIRRPGRFRYYLVIPYTVSCWLTTGILTGCTEGILSVWTKECSAYYHGFNLPHFSKLKPSMATNTQFQPSQSLSQPTLLNQVESSSMEPVPLSNVLILGFATTLSLITAPLVEPRYFILPWVFWRLLVPAWQTHEHRVFRDDDGCLEKTTGFVAIFQFGKKLDIRLILESIWFFSINIFTMYIFIAKPYQWRSENGQLLDGGRLQRFMW
jgi:alpha-1,2-glucosyltransferase